MEPGEVPPMVSEIRAMRGVNGGWSTKPQSRRLPATMKYSSSRWNPYLPATDSNRTTTAPAVSHTGRGSLCSATFASGVNGPLLDRRYCAP